MTIKNGKPTDETISKADAARFMEKFGPDVGLAYLNAGTPFLEALEIEFDKLKALQDSRESQERRFAHGDSY